MLRTKARRSISTIHEEFQMTLTRSLPIVLAFGIVGVPAWSAQDDQHQAHHPAGSASAPASKTMPGKSGAETARMDTQMKTMGAMHDRMMAAKTPEERNALMPEHMKAMQGGMAMMAGMAPTAFTLGKGSEFRQPMAVAVIGGLITSTVLSLLLVPVVYEFVDDFERWLSPRLGRLVTPREAPVAQPAE